MLDFIEIKTRKKQNSIEIYPAFKVIESKDLMTRGGDFYAIWNEGTGLWSTNEWAAFKLIDREIDIWAEEYMAKHIDNEYSIKKMSDGDSGIVDKWHKYCQKQMPANFYQTLDSSITFQDAKPDKESYASRRLPYTLSDSDAKAWDELVSVLYSPEERHKIEWSIGSIVNGGSRELQKFIVFYGAGGTGKSTILNVISDMFVGYTTTFDAKALGSSNDAFALETFKNNPLVAIQPDGDLSQIEDNTRLNSLVSHEPIVINEKFKSRYTNRFNCLLFMGTNRPIKITDSRSGLIRRLIDISPTGNLIERKKYDKLVKQIRFELGAIAMRCKQIYEEDPNYYDDYISKTMLSATNQVYDFVSEYSSIFMNGEPLTLKAAWEMYSTYVDEANESKYRLTRKAFKEELRTYFREFKERPRINGQQLRNVYLGFDPSKIGEAYDILDAGDIGVFKPHTIELRNDIPSVLDILCANYPAQYGNASETPQMSWVNVTTCLKDLNTAKLHYVNIPESSNHIVIDFDITDENGQKCLERNLEAASKWPPTYTELSKSGKGVHLHYIYDGDTSKLSRVYDDQIEVKIFTGQSSLRRKLTKCNDLQVATISSGLPIKEDPKVVNSTIIKNERVIRTLIKRNLNKEYHAHTTPSVCFIHDILDEAYQSGITYDVTDMRGLIFTFAAASTNQAKKCIDLVNDMKFKSETESEPVENSDDETKLVFFDCEVFPNLLLISWKFQGEGKPINSMINPNQRDIEKLIQFNLVGFNNRRYDNHILYARLLGYSNEEIYKLSKKLISTKKANAVESGIYFREAYNLSYTDIYDFASKKQSLKKWELELGIHHQELGLPWDDPVPEELWSKVAEYCKNDVIATEAVFNHLQGDWTARQILVDICKTNGIKATVNDTTNSLTARIIFGNEKNPELVYTDLSEEFPGYKFENDINMYRGTDLGKGGYVFSNSGIYTDVALLDISSLHPHSIRAMNCFGSHTKNFTNLLDTRIAIKHKDFDTAKKIFGSKLSHYLDDESKAKDLAQALKIAINAVYGQTAASYSNPFRDPRNKNNIVALRGALFMRTLQDEVTDRGFDIVAIKTDSIKIANATKEIVDFCFEFANKYGYTFEHEASYAKMCQINDADYIALYSNKDWCKERYGYVPKDNSENEGKWTTTGVMFARPYVFKTLFSHELLEFKDFCEIKEVSTALYLDMNEDLPDVSALEAQREKIWKNPSQFGYEADSDEFNAKIEDLTIDISKGHCYQFIGKVGEFCPIKFERGGGQLMRKSSNNPYSYEKYDAVNGTKGYRWLESENVRKLGKEDDIDYSYYNKFIEDAMKEINKYGDATFCEN